MQMEYLVKQQINFKFTYFFEILNISLVFQCLELNFLLRSAENSSIFNQ